MDSAENSQRYDRHLRLADFGPEAQRSLAGADIVVVGAGGLGSVVLSYLVGAGVGKITFFDSDSVDISNLHRQIIYRQSDVGRLKAEVALERLAGLNDNVSLQPVAARLSAENLAHYIRPGLALVLDCTDNFATRYLLADYCWRAGIPLISGSIVAYEGLVMGLIPDADNPCLRCLMPEPPANPYLAADIGVLAPAVGVIASLEATEALKFLGGCGTSLARTLLSYNASTSRFHILTRQKNPACPFCL